MCQVCRLSRSDVKSVCLCLSRTYIFKEIIFVGFSPGSDPTRTGSSSPCGRGVVGAIQHLAQGHQGRTWLPVRVSSLTSITSILFMPSYTKYSYTILRIHPETTRFGSRFEPVRILARNKAPSRGRNVQLFAGPLSTKPRAVPQLTCL